MLGRGLVFLESNNPQIYLTKELFYLLRVL